MLDVGAGDTEGERMGEKLERKEERGREWAQVGGRMPPPLPAPPTAGALDRNNKEISTNLHGPTVLTVSWGTLDPVMTPLPWDRPCHPLAQLD